MAGGIFADISSYQTFPSPTQYAAFSAQRDGHARLVMKATEGTGFIDGSFETFFRQCLAVPQIQIAGIYHYARPDLHPGPAGAVAEADWCASVLGSRLQRYPVMLDLEQNESLDWAHSWYNALAAHNLGGRKPVLYSSAFTFATLWASDLVLAERFDAAIADWYDPNLAPPVPPNGWRMRWWQFTDNQPGRPIIQVPGISMPVDLNIWTAAEPAEVQPGNMLIAHPTIAGRYDLLYVGTDGTIWHNWASSLSALRMPGFGAESWSMPLGTPLFPGSASGVWSSDGLILSVVAADLLGNLWEKSVNLEGLTSFDWARIPNQVMALPPTGQGQGTDTSLVTSTVTAPDGTQQSISYHVSK